MIERVVFCLVLLVQLTSAQDILSDRIMGLRVYGSFQAGLPVARLSSNPVTIEFDMKESEPPDVQFRVLHCDRDWNVTQNGFVNDDMLNRSKEPLRYAVAPDGVRFYRYHYAVKVPGIAGIDRFEHSGNYIFEILDEQRKNVLARGRFFVVEQALKLSMEISNRSLPSVTSPFNQVNKIEVGFVIPAPEEVNREVYFPLNLRTVDIYRNRQLYNSWRVDADDRNPNTYVDGFGTTKLQFVVDNVTPGNSYRRIDITNVTDYPEGRLLKAASGADIIRFQLPPRGDNHGVSSLTLGSRYADYVPFRFELAMEDRRYEEVYVVGDFNGWKPSAECLMTYDPATERYFWEASIRRGIYDYQYVVGNDDWIALEGNDWRTSNIYSAFVYYREDRLGGYDRILGFVQRTSAGLKEPTSQ